MIDYTNMIKVELKYNIFKVLNNIKYHIGNNQILLLLNIHEYENLPENIFEFIRFSKSWNRKYDFTGIYFNKDTSKYSYIHFNILIN